MRSFRVFLLFVFSLLLKGSSGNPLPDDSTKKKFVSRDTRTFYSYSTNWRRPLDSSLNNFLYCSPGADNFLFHSLSHPLAAGTQLGLPDNYVNGIKTRFDAFKHFFLNESYPVYYHTYSPFTQIFYEAGSKNENLLNVLHAQNLLPGLNLGFNFRSMTSDGIYQHEKSSLNNLRMFGSFATANNRYHLTADYFINKISAEMNGGIQTDSLFGDSVAISKALIPIELDSAKWTIRTRSATFHQSWGWGKKTKFPTNENGEWMADSLRKETFTPMVEMHHEFSYSRSMNIFHDDSTDNDFFSETNNLNASINDSFFFEKFRNELSLETKREKLGSDSSFHFRTFLFGASIAHEFTTIQFSELSAQIEDIIPQFQIQLLKPSRNYAMINGSSHLGNFKSGDYFFSGLFRRYDIPVVGSVALSFFNSSQTPDFSQLYFRSSHFQWTNHFERIRSQVVSLRISSNDWQKSNNITLSCWKSYKPVYFSEDAIPMQLNGSVSAFEIFFNHEFKLKHLHLNPQFQYLQLSNDNIFPLPLFTSVTSLFYENKIFGHHMLARFGLDVHWTGDYYAPAFQPGTLIFYPQSKSLMKMLPVMDFYFSFKVQQVRAFIRVTNVAQDLWQKGNYSFYRYPAPDRAFHIGIEWRFWN